MITNLPIQPDKWYSVSEAARFLGVHRTTVHQYLRHPLKPLPSCSTPNGYKIFIKGSDIVEYVESGRPKLGRPRMSGRRNSIK